MFLQGSMTALATPFTAEGIDEESFENFVEWQISEGTNGLVPCGTTGEAPTLTAKERDRLIRICVECASGGVPGIAGTGTNCTATTIEQTRAAKAAGADAALIVTPYYSRPTQEGLYRHFAAVASAVDIPIVLYNVPKRTGVDLPYEVLSADTWTAHEMLADKYAVGRIFLAGDACHLHPPAGGYGMNMGVGDGVDLGWKIAATLQGWGGPELVASYETERRPIHRAVIDEAMANYAIYVAPTPPEIEDDTPEGEAIRAKVGAGVQASKGREFHTLGTVLGLSYAHSPLIDAEDGPVPEHDNEIYTPSARPGCLAPHAWLPDGRSLYDLFGQGFALVVDADADETEVGKAVADAKALGAPLSGVRPVGVDVAALYQAPLALVRPDQHIAWRGDRWSGALDRATAADRRAPSVGSGFTAWR